MTDTPADFKADWLLIDEHEGDVRSRSRTAAASEREAVRIPEAIFYEPVGRHCAKAQSRKQILVNPVKSFGRGQRAIIGRLARKSAARKRAFVDEIVPHISEVGGQSR